MTMNRSPGIAAFAVATLLFSASFVPASGSAQSGEDGGVAEEFVDPDDAVEYVFTEFAAVPALYVGAQVG